MSIYRQTVPGILPRLRLLNILIMSGLVNTCCLSMTITTGEMMLLVSNVATTPAKSPVCIR